MNSESEATENFRSIGPNVATLGLGYDFVLRNNIGYTQTVVNAYKRLQSLLIDIWRTRQATSDQI